MSRNLRDILNHQLSALTWTDADSRAMMSTLKGEEPMKKKLPVSLILAVLSLLALAGIAAAAVSASPFPPPTTLYEEILRHQGEYDFALTLDKAYSDGRTLYYAYTLRMNRAPACTFGDGIPTGFDSWQYVFTNPDDPRDNKLMAHVTLPGEAEDAAFHAWFDPREEAYAAQDYVDMGDGCRLADGRACRLYDEGSVWIDETTLSGFQEVWLPENAAQDGQIDFELSVRFGTAVYYQNAGGAYRSDVQRSAPKDAFTVPLRCKVASSTSRLQ